MNVLIDTKTDVEESSHQETDFLKANGDTLKAENGTNWVLDNILEISKDTAQDRDDLHKQSNNNIDIGLASSRTSLEFGA